MRRVIYTVTSVEIEVGGTEQLKAYDVRFRSWEASISLRSLTPFATLDPFTSLAAVGKPKRCSYKLPLVGDGGFFSSSTTDRSHLKRVLTAMDGFRRCIKPPEETSVSRPVSMNVEPPVVYNSSDIEEDWKDISCLKERRRVQNRNAQVHPPGPHCVNFLTVIRENIGTRSS